MQKYFSSERSGFWKPLPAVSQSFYFLFSWDKALHRRASKVVQSALATLSEYPRRPLRLFCYTFVFLVLFSL